MSSELQNETASVPAKRIIKRYSNRKLYDMQDSRYVTLAQIAELVRAGEEVQIIDNATKADKTEATLALIISEEVKSRPKTVPLSTLRDLVHTRGEKLLTQLREGPIGRLFPATDEHSEEGSDESGKVESKAETMAEPGSSRTRLQDLVTSSRQTLEEWQAAIDERIHAALPVFYGGHQDELKRLTQRVDELEARLSALSAPQNNDTNQS